MPILKVEVEMFEKSLWFGFLKHIRRRDQHHRLLISGVGLRVGLFWSPRSKTSPYPNGIIGREHDFDG